MRVGVDTVYYASWTNVAVFSRGWHRCRILTIFQIPTLLPEWCALMGVDARVLKALSRLCLAAVNHKKTIDAEVATSSEARALLGVRRDLSNTDERPDASGAAGLGRHPRFPPPALFPPAAWKGGKARQAQGRQVGAVTLAVRY